MTIDHLGDAPVFATAAERDALDTFAPGDQAYALDYGLAYWDGSQWQRVVAGYMTPLHRVENAIQNVAATANIDTYAPLPTPIGVDVTYDGTLSVLVVATLSAYVDIGVNNAEVAVALDVSGSINSPAGSASENRLHVTAKQPVGVGLADTTFAVLGAGASHVEVMHAGAACALSDVAFSIVPLFLVPPGVPPYE